MHVQINIGPETVCRILIFLFCRVRNWPHSKLVNLVNLQHIMGKIVLIFDAEIQYVFLCGLFLDIYFKNIFRDILHNVSEPKYLETGYVYRPTGMIGIRLETLNRNDYNYLYSLCNCRSDSNALTSFKPIQLTLGLRFQTVYRYTVIPYLKSKAIIPVLPVEKV